MQPTPDKSLSEQGEADYATDFGIHDVTRHIASLKNSDKNVRQRAVQALVALRVAAIPALIDIFRDSNRKVRSIAAEVVYMIGIVAIPNLVEALQDSDEWARYRAALLLCKFDDPQTLPYSVIADSQLTVSDRIRILEAMQRFRSLSKSTLKDPVRALAIYCEKLLHRDDVTNMVIIRNFAHGQFMVDKI